MNPEHPIPWTQLAEEAAARARFIRNSFRWLALVIFSGALLAISVFLHNWFVFFVCSAFNGVVARIIWEIGDQAYHRFMALSVEARRAAQYETL